MLVLSSTAVPKIKNIEKIQLFGIDSYFGFCSPSTLASLIKRTCKYVDITSRCCLALASSDLLDGFPIDFGLCISDMVEFNWPEFTAAVGSVQQWYWILEARFHLGFVEQISILAGAMIESLSRCDFLESGNRKLWKLMWNLKWRSNFRWRSVFNYICPVEIAIMSRSA